MKKLLVIALFLIELSCINIKKPVPDTLKTKKVKIDVLITLSFKKHKNFNIKESEIDKNLKQNEIALLSPACASLDQFKNYKKRGKEFKNLILI